ncbi:DEAD/DEAH box helicase [Candidatus Mycobacterium wuenschmannii]|uniref:DEAD/DEAH box helicase n=1 Tax=Candidatus Mycobacterium wuenschmannii TaxID=3027808 RepID=A0ABY8VV93_9MYCO|nr:DEAD/DEAH box helicase [Candidatus Mycobacterium wuenschmannii]WIM87437.1 DEAD/DEAH box helicase [Candidatus Mycobacterium wuenschmannii]
MAEVAAGERIVVRDEEWLVRAVRNTEHDGVRVEVTGVTPLVRDQDAVFFGSLDKIDRLDPREGKLVADDSAGFRSSRLWLESIRRGSPVPSSETRITVGHRGLLDRMDYQLRPASQALQNLRPRILIGDAVGLGKTLEIGILLSELIRRGRGERILVVTPRAVLEQFQRELWTRFAIPLIRLDSSGIQKVRQTLPSSRNPFSYYKRVIVSIDTLKNPARYKHHLKSQKWDAVVIDECHNLINRGTQNNELAKLLAAQTDALILASATPHNGKPESFAELVHLLDPTAIVDRTDYSAKDIEHLYVRRHRNSPDVKIDVAHKWKERHQPKVIEVVPTPAEAEVLRELEDTWLHPKGASVVTGQGRQLFPWTLFKAFLSSPKAVRSSISRRLATIGETSGTETKALQRLDHLAETADASTPSKLLTLVEHLKNIGISKDSPTRVVVFSERIDTLTWLQQELPRRLKLPAASVRTLYATLPDDTVQDVVNGFGQASSAIRVLLASDMASEGLNLHHECHQLVHYDLPWSFIRIQQRNGRIDRYGQLHAPEISALALAGEDDVTSDLKVVTKLLKKEYEANRALGDAGVLLDLHDAELEELAVLKAIRDGKDIDDVVPEPTPKAINPFAAIMAVGGQHEADATPETAYEHSLFDDDDNFLIDELADVAGEIGEQKLDVYRETDTDLIAFAPPPDLITRFRDLPSDYIAEQDIDKRLRLTGSAKYAQSRLDWAQALEARPWPDVHFLAPIHPVLDWAAERAVARFGRIAIPVLSGDVDSPVYLTQAVWANELGKPAIAHWGAIRGLPDRPDIGDFDEALDAAGITEGAVNPGLDTSDFADAQYHVAVAVDAATEHLRDKRDDIEADLIRRVDSYRQSLTTWEQAALSIVDDPKRRTGSKLTVTETTDQSLALIDAQAAAGDPFVRVIAVIVPRGGA